MSKRKAPGAEVSVAAVTASAPTAKRAKASAVPAKKGAAKKESSSSSKAVASSEPAVSASSTSSAGGHDVVITSSKVCQAFKKRATAVEEAVKSAKGSVIINEEKPEGRNPDRGTFRIVVKGKTIVNLPGMARPFPAMKALDMDAVSKEVVAALK